MITIWHHVGITIIYDEIEFSEVFPTLDLSNRSKRTETKLIRSVKLNDNIHYLETYQWRDGKIRQLLRTFK